MESRRGKPLDAQIRLLLDVVDQGYEKKAWHGPNLKGSTRGLSSEVAAWRPGPRRHNIWEIVLHAAYWKYAVRRMLTGEPRGTFPCKGSNWFPCPVPLTPRRWREVVALLAQEHSELRSAIQDLQRSRLQQKPSSSKYTRMNLIYGAACHDVYHAGQIQLLKRLYSDQK
jgi:DinB family protein